MRQVVLPLAVLAAALASRAEPSNAQSSDGSGSDARQLISQWQASDSTCRSPAAAAIAAVGACEQRDTYSKLLAQRGYCYGPTEKGGPAGWTSCGEGASGAPSAKALQDSTRARTSAQFHRMGGVFVLPVSVNGPHKLYFIVDSGAANVQIPEETAEEMKRNGTLSDDDFLGQRRFTLADGRGIQQRIFRLRSLHIGERAMENVLAAVGAPRSRPLLGQSFLRRLSWWKIDNVRNAIEFEFTGSF